MPENMDHNNLNIYDDFINPLLGFMETFNVYTTYGHTRRESTTSARSLDENEEDLIPQEYLPKCS